MEREYVGIDFHRRWSVVVRVSAGGERLSVVRVDNDPVAMAAAVTEAGPSPEVVIEATYGWYWVVDLLQELGATVHLANPKPLNWGDRRVKNDVVDATDLADMLRLGRLPEAWIAPPAVRQLRELVRYRAKLVQLRTGLKAQVHAVMAKEGVLPPVGDMFGRAGTAQLDGMSLGRNYSVRVESLRDLIEVYDREVVMLERDLHAHLLHHPGYQAVQAINGVGRHHRRHPGRGVRFAGLGTVTGGQRAAGSATVSRRHRRGTRPSWRMTTAEVEIPATTTYRRLWAFLSAPGARSPAQVKRGRSFRPAGR